MHSLLPAHTCSTLAMALSVLSIMVAKSNLCLLTYDYRILFVSKGEMRDEINFLSKVSVTTVLWNNVSAISMYFQYKMPKFLQKKKHINFKYAF